MKINCDKKILNFKDQPIKVEGGDLTVGEALANILLGHQTGGKYKLFVLAQRMKGQTEVDEADLVLIKEALEKTEVYNLLLNGRVSSVLNNLVVGRIMEELK